MSSGSQYRWLSRCTVLTASPRRPRLAGVTASPADVLARECGSLAGRTCWRAPSAADDTCRGARACRAACPQRGLVGEPAGLGIDVRVNVPVAEAAPHDDRHVGEERLDDRPVGPFLPRPQHVDLRARASRRPTCCSVSPSWNVIWSSTPKCRAHRLRCDRGCGRSCSQPAPREAVAARRRSGEHLEEAPVPLDAGPGGDHDHVDVALDPGLRRDQPVIDPPVGGDRHRAEVRAEPFDEGDVARLDRLDKHREVVARVGQDVGGTEPAPARLEHEVIAAGDGLDVEERGEEREDVRVVDHQDAALARRPASAP